MSHQGERFRQIRIRANPQLPLSAESQGRVGAQVPLLTRLAVRFARVGFAPPALGSAGAAQLELSLIELALALVLVLVEPGRWE